MKNARLSILVTAALLAIASPAQAQCPDQVSVARTLVSGTSVGGRVLLAGGYPGGSNAAESRVDLYHLGTGAWTLADLSLPRYAAAAASAGGFAFIAGGGRTSGFGGYSATDQVDIYDSAANTWTTTTLAQRRMFLAGTSVGSHVLFAGGIRGGAPPFSAMDTVDLYDTATNTWTTAQLSDPRAHLAAAAAGGLALFGGGYRGFYMGAVVSDVVDIFDSTTGLWSTSQLSAPRMQLTATSLGTLVLFAGGLAFNGVEYVPSDVVDIYDTTTGSWSTAQLSVARSNLAAASVGGRALFAGGNTGSAPTDVVDVFDGSRWFTLRLSEARRDLVGVSAGSEAVFAGGWTMAPDGTESLSSVVDRFPAGFPAPFGFGDGTEGPCPCSNPGGTGRGCANSSGVGARLEGVGCNSLTADSLVLLAEGLPRNVSVLLMSATGSASCTPFGDGLVCTGGTVQRVGARSSDSAGRVSWGPNLPATWGWSAGDARRLQAIYRDPLSPCGSGFNLSNGLEVVLAP